jgi:hypothetical protein
MGEARRRAARAAEELQRTREARLFAIAGPQTPLLREPKPPKSPIERRPVICPECRVHRMIVVDVRYWPRGLGGVRQIECNACCMARRGADIDVRARPPGVVTPRKHSSRSLFSLASIAAVAMATVPPPKRDP